MSVRKTTRRMSSLLGRNKNESRSRVGGPSTVQINPDNFNEQAPRSSDSISVASSSNNISVLSVDMNSVIDLYGRYCAWDETTNDPQAFLERSQYAHRLMEFEVNSKHANALATILDTTEDQTIDLQEFYEACRLGVVPQNKRDQERAKEVVYALVAPFVAARPALDAYDIPFVARHNLATEFTNRYHFDPVISQLLSEVTGRDASNRDRITSVFVAQAILKGVLPASQDEDLVEEVRHIATHFLTLVDGHVTATQAPKQAMVDQLNQWNVPEREIELVVNMTMSPQQEQGEDVGATFGEIGAARRFGFYPTDRSKSSALTASLTHWRRSFWYMFETISSGEETVQQDRQEETSVAAALVFKYLINNHSKTPIQSAILCGAADRSHSRAITESGFCRLFATKMLEEFEIPQGYRTPDERAREQEERQERERERVFGDGGRSEMLGVPGLNEDDDTDIVDLPAKQMWVEEAGGWFGFSKQWLVVLPGQLFTFKEEKPTNDHWKPTTAMLFTQEPQVTIVERELNVVCGSQSTRLRFPNTATAQEFMLAITGSPPQTTP